MRRNSLFLLAAFIIGISILFLAAQKFSSSGINPFLSPTPYPTIDAQNPDASGTLPPSSSKNIEVLSPRTGDNIKSGFRVEGNARTFESNVRIRLTTDDGTVLIDTNTTANAPDVGQFGPFEKTLVFSTDAKTGTLEVFQNSAKDGSEIDKVTIPVVFE